MAATSSEYTLEEVEEERWRFEGATGVTSNEDDDDDDDED